MNLTLSSTQIRFLRSKAHSLKAVLQVGAKGITDAFLLELNSALEQHELLKVKLAVPEGISKQTWIDQIIDGTHSCLVQYIGHTIVLYKPNQESPKLALPKF